MAFAEERVTIKMGRTILHCDMNNFYASVECMMDPGLKKYPLAVCGETEERHGIVLAKNYKAKDFGVKTGEAVWQAKRKCPGLVTVKPHYGEYSKISGIARDIYGTYTDLVEPFGLDECWLDISGSDGMAVADSIRRRVKSELGVTVSVGVSFNKVFAKLGSDMKKPDAVTVIPENGFKEKVWSLPASDMLGVGPSVGKKLASLGIYTIGDIAVRSESFFRCRFGKCGTELWRCANGYERSPVVPRDMEMPDKSVGHGITAIRDMTEPEQVWRLMLWLTQEIGHRLYTWKRRAGGVQISVKDKDFGVRQWQTVLAYPTASPYRIASQAFALFERSYGWEKPVRAVTVRAIGLTSADVPVQLDLFTDALAMERIEALDETVENLRGRFGNDIIKNASLMHVDSLCHE